ncbi:EamA family transporter [Streptomyces sp. RS10V-4]|uniref:DMT family transporter n=1 Tax=Streptomyces rhizoryzae TaxID=2932493 RepID=UPI00200344D2|nr:EamA family transporter [Streptomyces rhizoryzae]MCK7626080.1 EamA family transporter [Streptomyces rhizoryzae]
MTSTVATARRAVFRGGVTPVLAAAFLWGTVGPAQILAATSASPVAIGACRMLLGGFVLGLCTARPAGIRSVWQRHTWRWTVVSIAVTAAFQACFLEAVARSGAALATAVTFGTVPVVSGVCGRLLAGERLGGRWACGTAGAVVGIVLLLVPADGAATDGVGVLLGIVAGAGFGIYISATKQLEARGADTATAAPTSVFCAGLLVSPWVFTHPQGLAEPRALVLIGWLALATTALGYLLFTRGVRRLSGATVGTLSLAEPLVAAVWGVALLGERPGAAAVLGAVLLLGGLVVVSLPARRRAGPVPAAEGGS